MKILILSNNDGGLFHFRRELLENLLKEHQIYVSVPYGEYIDNLVELGCEYIPCEFDRRGTNPIGDIKQYSQYKKLINEIKPDVVFTYTIKPNVYGGMACAKSGVPYIANVTGLGTSIMNPSAMQKLSLFLYKMGLRKAHTVFFQNKTNLKFMQEHKVVGSQCRLLPGSGVNLETNQFEDYPNNDDKIEFLTIGRIMKDKGTDELLKAAEIIKGKHPDVIFTVIGDFDGDEFKKRITSAHNAGIINYAGTQKDVHSFMKRSHATIHPSYHEGLSNVLLETASSGRPVIATNVPGCKETYDDGVSGIAFEYRNVQSLVDAIERFLSLSHEEKAEMGRQGRKKVEKEFDRNIVIKAYQAVLEEISNSSKR